MLVLILLAMLQTNYVTFHFSGNRKTFPPFNILIPSKSYDAHFLDDVVSVDVHEHPLCGIITDSSGWACNGIYNSAGCLSGCTGFYQSLGMRRFTCQGCDFDLCQPCVNAHYSKDQSACNDLLILPATVKVSSHQHPLTCAPSGLSGNNASSLWECQGMKTHGACRGGLNVDMSTLGWLQYRCTECDYSMCKYCVRYFQS